MPSKSPENALRDILFHVDLAEQFVLGFDYTAFSDDLRTFYAVTRCLEIVSEASRRLPEEMKGRHPSIAWKNMAGAGNIYQHDYVDVAARFVWDTLKRQLPALRLVIDQELQRFGDMP
jgi:uncharacterized protein with HEPN domain